MDAVWIKATDGHNFLNLDNADFAACRRRLIKIARGFAENHIAAFIGFPRLYDGKVRKDAALEDIFLAVKDFFLEIRKSLV